MEQVEDSRTTKPPMVVMPFGYPTRPNSADGQAISIGREGATHNLEVTSVWNGPFLITVSPSGPGYPVGGGPTIQFPYKGHHVHV